MLPLHWKSQSAKSSARKRFPLDSFAFVQLTKVVMTPPISKATSICRHSFLFVALQWKHTQLMIVFEFCNGHLNSYGQSLHRNFPHIRIVAILLFCFVSA